MIKNINNRILEYGLYLVVFLLPLQTRFIFNFSNEGYLLEYNLISLYIIDILILSLLGFYLLTFLRAKKVVGANIAWPWFLLAGFDLVIFISIWFAPDKGLAFYRYLLFLLGLGLFFLILKIKYKQGVLLLFFSASVLLQGLIASGQFLLQTSPALKWLGMARHHPGDLGASVIETFGSDGVGERWLRAYGGLDHPNILGAFLGIGILILLISLANQKRGNKTPRQNFYLLGLLVAVVAIIFSFSRSAWLGLFLALVFLLISLLVRRKYLALKNTLINILIAGLLVLVLFITYNNLFQARLKSEGRLETKSQVERLAYNNEAKVIIKDNWLLGVGLGNYVKVEMTARPQDEPWTFQPVHNVFLLVWAEVGIFGLAFLLAFLLMIIIKSVKQRDFFNLSILISLLSMMMFDHFWWSLHFGILLFWFIMGIVVKRLDNKL